MNKYDEELLKNSRSMIKGIAVEADRLNVGHNLSLTLDDVQGITEFGLALGCQISEAEKVNTGKLFTPFLFVAIDIRTDFVRFRHSSSNVLRCYKLFNALYK